MSEARTKPKRKFYLIKKELNSVDFQNKEKLEHDQAYLEKMKLVSSLVIETPCSSIESTTISNNSKYHQISMPQKTSSTSGVGNSVMAFLDSMDIHQLDFRGMLEATRKNQFSNRANIFAKINKPQNQGSSLLKRRLERVNKLSLSQE